MQGFPAIFRFSVNSLIGLMMLCIPFSVKLFFPGINTEIIYPAEIFIGLLAVIFCYHWLVTREYTIEKKFLRHPITLLILAYLGISIISAFFSSMPLVSVKAVLVKSAYIVVFHFFMQRLIFASLENFLSLVRIYAWALGCVIIYSLFSQIPGGFRRSTAGFVSYPFYNDHTIYAAAIALVLPIVAVSALFPKLFNVDKKTAVPLLLLFLLFVAGQYFAFCRAAWLSVIAAAILLCMVLMRFRFYMITGLLLIGAGAVFLCYDAMVGAFKKNHIDSNVHAGGLYEQIFSLTNITNDVSNTERLNRWSCALRMFNDRPVLGFGPGTYQFRYLYYQRPGEMTYLSVKHEKNSAVYVWSQDHETLIDKHYKIPLGSGGSAHSEYFLELSESGFIAFVCFAALYFVALYYGIRIFRVSPSRQKRIMALAVLTGLTTYFVHGLFNNFLDDCKLASLFWLFFSVLVSLDLSLKDEQQISSASTISQKAPAEPVHF